jgi:thiamine-monophosphate kinase
MKKLSEFEIIEQFFHSAQYYSSHTMVGVGDDAAVFSVPTQQQVVTTVDALVEGIHFPVNAKASDIGYKSLAVSLSDLAAMGAKPENVLLALTLPSANAAWLQDFAAGFFELAKQYQIDLIGGNITRGPLSITVTANGFVPKNKAILRHGAKAGDLIYVTGTLGDAGLALAAILRDPATVNTFLLNRFYRPTPRVAVGMALRGIAHAMIDISDGLYADLQKMLIMSGVGGDIQAKQLPLSVAMRCCEEKEAWQYALTAGEDYELCFTIPAAKQSKIAEIGAKTGCEIHLIGEVTAANALTAWDDEGHPVKLLKKGYEHFSN